MCRRERGRVHERGRGKVCGKERDGERPHREGEGESMWERGSVRRGEGAHMGEREGMWVGRRGMGRGCTGEGEGW